MTGSPGVDPVGGPQVRVVERRPGGRAKPDRIGDRAAVVLGECAPPDAEIRRERILSVNRAENVNELADAAGSDTPLDAIAALHSPEISAGIPLGTADVHEIECARPSREGSEPVSGFRRTGRDRLG